MLFSCLLILLLLATVISFALLFFEYSLRLWIVASVRSSMLLSPSFLGILALSMWLIRCETYCIINNFFFVLWSISLSSSLVYFKNGPEYLPKETSQVFIPSIKFLEQSLVSRSFLVFLSTSYFFFISVWWCLLLLSLLFSLFSSFFISILTLGFSLECE